MGQQAAPPEQKADGGKLTSFMQTLGLVWEYDQVVYDRMKPYPRFEVLPPEYFFVSRTGNPTDAFNREHPVTEDLVNVAMLYSGFIKEGSKEGVSFAPLLQTSSQSGVMEWGDYTESSFNFMSRAPSVQLRQTPVRVDNKYSHVVAGHITSDSDTTPLNVIFCADIDLLSDWYFSERRQNNFDLKLDNVTFILNAVDSLAGNDQFIKLRSRQAKLRTLEFVEAQTRKLRETLSKEEKEADESMKSKLEEARAELQKEVDTVVSQEGLDARNKEQLLNCLLYTSPSPRDQRGSRMPSSA